jgi:hypothetical protein
VAYTAGHPAQVYLYSLLHIWKNIIVHVFCSEIMEPAVPLFLLAFAIAAASWLIERRQVRIAVAAISWWQIKLSLIVSLLNILLCTAVGKKGYCKEYPDLGDL